MNMQHAGCFLPCNSCRCSTVATVFNGNHCLGAHRQAIDISGNSRQRRRQAVGEAVAQRYNVSLQLCRVYQPVQPRRQALHETRPSAVVPFFSMPADFHHQPTVVQTPGATTNARAAATCICAPMSVLLTSLARMAATRSSSTPMVSASFTPPSTTSSRLPT